MTISLDGEWPSSGSLRTCKRRRPYRVAVYPPLEMEALLRGARSALWKAGRGSDGSFLADGDVSSRPNDTVLTRLGRGAVWLAGRRIAAACQCGKEKHVVAVPSYHCGSEIEALSKAGLSLRFYRIDPSLAVDPDSFAEAISESCAAYVVSHFGWPPRVDGLWPPLDDRAIDDGSSTDAGSGAALDALVVEDAAHAFHSDYREGVPVGTLGWAAVYSVRKAIGATEGGALRLSDSSATGMSPRRGAPGEARSCAGLFGYYTDTTHPDERENGAFADALGLSFLRRWRLRRCRVRAAAAVSQALLRIAQGEGAVAAGAARMLGFASRSEGAAASGNLTAAVYGLDFHWSISERALEAAASSPDLLTRLVLAGHERSAAAAARRRNYVELVEVHGLGEFVPPGFRSLPQGASPLFVPVIAHDRESVVSNFYSRGIRVVEVWPVAHPATPESYERELRPARSTLVGLPCHHLLSPAALETVATAAWEVMGRKGSRPTRPQPV